MIKFTWNGSVSKEMPVIFKNSKKLACEIPDMGVDIPIG
jgi:hypothetical protein